MGNEVERCYAQSYDYGGNGESSEQSDPRSSGINENSFYSSSLTLRTSLFPVRILRRSSSDWTGVDMDRFLRMTALSTDNDIKNNYYLNKYILERAATLFLQIEEIKLKRPNGTCDENLQNNSTKLNALDELSRKVAKLYVAALSDWLLNFLSQFQSTDVTPDGINLIQLTNATNPFPYYSLRSLFHTLIHDPCAPHIYFHVLLNLSLFPTLSRITPGYVLEQLYRFSVLDSPTENGFISDNYSGIGKFAIPTAEALNDLKISPARSYFRAGEFDRAYRKAVEGGYRPMRLSFYSIEMMFWASVVQEGELRMLGGVEDPEGGGGSDPEGGSRSEDSLGGGSKGWMERLRGWKRKLGDEKGSEADSESSGGSSKSQTVGAATTSNTKTMPPVSETKSSTITAKVTTAAAEISSKNPNPESKAAPSETTISKPNTDSSSSSSKISETEDSSLSPNERHSLLSLLDGLHTLLSKDKGFDIPYFLVSGTLLGAVRNHGLIPWTEDAETTVDVGYFHYLMAGALLQGSRLGRDELQREEKLTPESRDSALNSNSVSLINWIHTLNLERRKSIHNIFFNDKQVLLMNAAKSVSLKTFYSKEVFDESKTDPKTSKKVSNFAPHGHYRFPYIDLNPLYVQGAVEPYIDTETEGSQSKKTDAAAESESAPSTEPFDPSNYRMLGSDHDEQFQLYGSKIDQETGLEILSRLSKKILITHQHPRGRRVIMPATCADDINRNPFTHHHRGNGVFYQSIGYGYPLTRSYIYPRREVIMNINGQLKKFWTFY